MNDIILDIDKSIINIFSNKNLNQILNELNLNNYYEVKQTHSDIIHIIDNNYTNTQIGDALITKDINKPIIIKVADCITILIYDKENNIIASIHSGWKGTLEYITNKTIKIIQEKYNSKPQNINAYIYPSIRLCHFEIEEDVYKLFKDKIKNIDKYTIKKDIKYYIDLQSIVIDNLKELGINNIFDTNICTYCNHDKYYSYRYNHTDKRNILLAMIKE